MSITDPTVIQMAVPANRIDQIIGVHAGSFTIAAAPAFGTSTATDTFNTGFGDNCFFQGVFSTDGGATWNDLGVYRPNLSTPGQPVLQTVTCFAYVTSTGILTMVGVNWYDIPHSTSTSYTIQYKVVLFAKDNQKPLIPLPTSESIQYSSKYNFQKIFVSQPYTDTGAGIYGTTHNLGYVPNVRAFFQPNTSLPDAGGVFSVPGGAMTSLDLRESLVIVDASNLIINSIAPGIGYYRVYYDK